MTETDRNLLTFPVRTNSSYEQEFIDSFFLGCFSHIVYVVIKQRTLYVYASRSEATNQTHLPNLFFNLNYMDAVLEEDSLRISNQFATINLTHRNPEVILKLLEAINKGRFSIGPEQLYPNKFNYLDRTESKSLQLH